MTKKRNDKRVNLNPLQFEEALGALLQTGPNPKDEELQEERQSQEKEQKQSAGEG